MSPRSIETMRAFGSRSLWGNYLALSQSEGVANTISLTVLTYARGTGAETNGGRLSGLQWLKGCGIDIVPDELHPEFPIHYWRKRDTAHCNQPEAKAAGTRRD